MPRQDGIGGRAPTLLWWLVLLFVSTSLGGPNKVNVIVPFCSCTCCWNRSRFTCVEGSDINWLSFMSLIIATENTYTNPEQVGSRRVGAWSVGARRVGAQKFGPPVAKFVLLSCSCNYGRGSRPSPKVRDSGSRGSFCASPACSKGRRGFIK